MISDWDKIINRIKSEVAYKLGTGKSEGSVVALRLMLMIDCNGNPLLWTVEGKKIEPGYRAKELLTEVMAQELLESY